jgi:quercetin dioxygenase-like cupin family protein
MNEGSLTWSPELDAVVASSNHHRLVMENESVRVLETIIGPGEITNLHTHQWPAAAYFLSCSDMVRRDENGTITMDSRTLDTQRQPGEAVWTPSLGPHTLENVGNDIIHVVTVEVKQRPGS